MKIIKHLLLLLILSYSALSYSQLNGRVIKVKDGDTIVVLDEMYQQHTIRVADIDCPERYQPFGAKAKDFVSDQIYFEEVSVIIKNKDRYGRTIGILYYDNNNKILSEELLKNGLAWHYKKYSNNNKLAKLEEYARINNIGLWINTKAIAPWYWRKK